MCELSVAGADVEWVSADAGPNGEATGLCARATVVVCDRRNCASRVRGVRSLLHNQSQSRDCLNPPLASAFGVHRAPLPSIRVLETFRMRAQAIDGHRKLAAPSRVLALRFRQK